MNNPARLSMALAMDRAANASALRRWPRAVVVKPLHAWLIWGVQSRSRRHAKYRQYGGVGFASCQVASVFFLDCLASEVSAACSRHRARSYVLRSIAPCARVKIRLTS
jgi:hypothetical protein